MTSPVTIGPFRMVLCFAAVAMLGWMVLPKLKVDLLPKERSPSITVFFSLQDSSPDIVEQQVSSILEGAFSQLSQVKKIKSISTYDGGRVEMFFDKTADIPFKRFEVETIIRRVYPSLPAHASYPVIAEGGNTVEQPLLVYTINAPFQPFRIKQETEDIFRKAFAGTEGIKEVWVSGVENIQLAIRFDKTKCDAWHIDPGKIIESLQSYFSISFPGEFVTSDGSEFFLRMPSPAASIEAIENIAIPSNSNQLIRLKEIAQVYMEEQEATHYSRINGEDAVTLTLFAREGENKIVVGKRAKEIVAKAKLQLPQAFDVRLAYDDTEFLQKEMNKNYVRTGLSIIILIIFLLLAYRSWRYLLTIFSGLIISLCLTIILAWLFRIDIHLYTLAGLAISFGIIIDNAIVMLDFYRQRRNRKIFLALLGANVTTMAALCLVYFLPDEEKKNLIDFSIIVVLTLLSSLATALWFIPNLYELIHQPFAKKKTSIHFFRRINKILSIYFLIIQFLAGYRKIFIVLVVLTFGLPVFMLPSQWEGDQWYHHWYNASIGSNGYQEKIKPVVNVCLGGTLRLFANTVYERSGYRDPEKTKLYLYAEMPYGNTAAQLNYIFTDFEKYLSTVEGIDKFVTNVYNGQRGNIEISFKEGYENSAMPYQLKSHLIARSLDWGGVGWAVYGLGQGFNNMGGDQMASFRVTMKGYNYDELERQANRLAEKLVKNKRAQKINTNEQLEYGEKSSKEYFLNLDPLKTALHNTSKTELLDKLSSRSKAAHTAAKVTINNQYYPVVLKESMSEEYSSYDVLRQTISLDSVRRVRIENIGKLELSTVSSGIHKEDRQYIRVVGFDYIGSSQLGYKFLDETLSKFSEKLPVGYSAEQFTWNWDWGATKRKYSLILVLMLIIFFIGSILFENLKEPFIIISMIPISFIGLFLIFSLGQFYFDQGGYAAFVMLGGLVANAAIFIVNDFNNLRRNSARSVNRLLIKATAYRSRTILLTTISTCCGLIPFLIEGQNEVFWFSLAIGAIGGLLFSLFATFIVLPVLLWNRN